MDLQYLKNVILAGSIFVLVFSVWTSCVVLWVIQNSLRRKALQQRIGTLAGSDASNQAFILWREEIVGKVSAKAQRGGLHDRLEQLRIEASWKRPAHLVIATVVVIAVVIGASILLLGGSPLLGGGIPVAILIAFSMRTKSKVAKFKTLFERQFVDALGVAARALRAGHPLGASFQLVATEIDEPVRSVFRQIVQGQAVGVDLRDAIREVASETYSDEVRLFATAVAIQLESGGNLANLMDTMAGTMRARMRLNRRARVLIAQTTMSKNVLIALPILTFAGLNFTAPEYMRTFYVTMVGNLLLGLAVGTVMFGIFVMNKLSVLKY